MFKIKEEYYCENIWLKLVLGPSKFINDAVDSISQAKTTILNVNKDIVWADQVKEHIKHKTKDKCSYNKNFKIIDIHINEQEEISSDCDNIGEYILDNYSDKNKHRSTAKMSIQQYIYKNEELKNKVFWITCEDSKFEEGVIKFLEDYPNDTTSSNPCFVLEMSNRQYQHYSDRKPVNHMSYEDSITELDIQLLINCCLGLEEKNTLSNTWRNYVSVVISKLCGSDLQLAMELVADAERFKEENPLRLISGCKKGEISNCENDKDYKNKLWEAQIRFVFPMVEIERIKIIEQKEDELKKVLGNVNIKQLGRDEFVTDPYELEFKTLINDIDNVFSLPEKKKITFLKKIRDSLAHLSCVDVSDLARFFDKMD